MASLYYPFYDTAPFGLVANTTHNLFQSSLGSGANRTKANTNWIGAGALPDSNSYVIQHVGAYVDDLPDEADILAIWEDTHVEMYINNQTVLLVPLRSIAMGAGFQGAFNEVAASDAFLIGPSGMGLKLEPFLQLGEGVSFRVEIGQVAATTVAIDVKFLMSGILTRP